MNFGITKKIGIHTFRYNFSHLLYKEQNILKCTSANSLSKFYHKNTNGFSYLLFSKNLTQTFLCNTSISLSQRRNISNGVSDIELYDKSTSDLLPIEEAINLTSSVVPNIVKAISEWKIVEFAQQILLKVHETTGLPWWASIAVTAFIARITITLPLTLTQVRTAAKLEMNKLEMNDIAKRLMTEVNYKRTYQHWPEGLAKQIYQTELKKEWNNLIVRDNCHPAKCYILALIQFPLWISFSFATRNLCFMLPRQDFMSQVTRMEMTVGGFGWITNLVDVDHYMILPIILGLLNLTILEVHQLFRNSPQTKMEKRMRIFFRILIIGTVPFATYLPAATTIYWISSSSYGLMQAFLINSPRLRRLFRIPVVESELKNPYQYFYNNFKTKLTNK